MQALFCQQMIRKNLWTYSNLWLLCWCCIQQTYYWSPICSPIILKSCFGCVKEACHMNISGCFWWCVWYYVNHFLMILYSVFGCYHSVNYGSELLAGIFRINNRVTGAFRCYNLKLAYIHVMLWDGMHDYIYFRSWISRTVWQTLKLSKLFSVYFITLIIQYI